LAAEVEQLKSQLEKEKKRRLSQSVAEPTAKKPKPSAAASRKKLVVIDDYIITTKLFDGLFVHSLPQCAQMQDQCEMH
jgi:UTP-glucose-1-phosphate uridylyltransferase